MQQVLDVVIDRAVCRSIRLALFLSLCISIFLSPSLSNPRSVSLRLAISPDMLDVIWTSTIYLAPLASGPST